MFNFLPSRSSGDAGVDEDKAAHYRSRSVDGYGYGPIRRRDNGHLSDSELHERIQTRIAQGEPVARLLDELNRRG